MKPLFFTMMGYPGAGKSTFAAKLAAEMNIVRLNSDSLRLYMFTDAEKQYDKGNWGQLFGAMDYAASEIVKAGQSVIYDAKCNHVSERQKNAELARKAGGAHVTIWVNVPLSVSLDSTLTREESIGSVPFTAERAKLHANDTLEEPLPEEPAIVINGRETFEQQYESFCAQLRALQSAKN